MSALKAQDLFGHPVELKFNHGGSRHKTAVGGFLSIFIRMALFSYIVLIFHRMVTYDDNKETTTINIIDQKDSKLHQVKFKNTRAKLFLVIRGDSSNLNQNDYSKDLETHLRVSAVQ